MIGDNFSFSGDSLNYNPTSNLNKMSGGVSSLGGAGYEAYLKPTNQGGIGSYTSPYDWKNNTQDFNFGKGESSYSSLNYKPTQSDTLGGKGSGTTSSIENGGQQSLGQAWGNLSDKSKSDAIMGGIDLLATAFGGNKQQQQQVQAPSGSFRPNVRQLDMKQFNSRLQMPQRTSQQPALMRVI